MVFFGSPITKMILVDDEADLWAGPPVPCTGRKCVKEMQLNFADDRPVHGSVMLPNPMDDIQDNTDLWFARPI